MRPLQPFLLLLGGLASLLPREAFPRLRSALYRLFGMRLGAGTLLLGKLELSGRPGLFDRLEIGAGCVVNSPLFIDTNGGVRIGDGVSIGHHCVLVTSSHEPGPESFRAGALVCKPIVIESGVWLGACVTVLPGVTIGRGCVLAAGSVVAADLPPNKLAGGVPARVIKALAESA